MTTYEIVDLFAGPGGLDVAAGWLGHRVTGIEWDANACRTRRAAGLVTVEDDVRKYGPDLFPRCNVLAGGPPCQTFSTTGNGLGRRALSTVLDAAYRMAEREDVQPLLDSLDDERTGLVLEPLRWALAALDSRERDPFRRIVLEQVPTVLPVWEAFAGILRDEGYVTATGVLRSEQHGVPQTRRRAVMVASWDDHVTLPTPTHRPYYKGVAQDEGDQSLMPWQSMGDVIDRCEDYEVISNYGTGGDASKRGRRTSYEPSATVTGKISRNRVVASLDGAELPRFSHSEAGVLQSFPTHYPWSGADVPQQIGNAVPPRMAEAILRAALA